MLFLNRGEAASLVGLDDQATTQVLAETVRERLPHVEVVLTLGSEGVWYLNGDTQYKLPAHSVTPKDTTAAGDTFIGYFMAARQNDTNPLAALRLASAAAALCVQREGAAPSIPVLSEVLDVAKDWPQLELL
ncbi:carbohydrate kinase family protein [Modicisalibacter luteus]|uniref:carbohydrate kinase family protein n=1 Tax=Modicisalibacter luteus TaxID=453962 RepID=UPI0036358E94